MVPPTTEINKPFGNHSEQWTGVLEQLADNEEGRASNQQKSREVATRKQVLTEKSPARFNPFDREDYTEDIRNVFPELSKRANAQLPATN